MEAEANELAVAILAHRGQGFDSRPCQERSLARGGGLGRGLVRMLHAQLLVYRDCCTFLPEVVLCPKPLLLLEILQTPYL